MASYQEMIIEDTGCNPHDAVMIEHIMREDIFHSTLDWQTRAEIRSAARKAARILTQDQPTYEEYFVKAHAVFEEMRHAAQQNAKG